MKKLNITLLISYFLSFASISFAAYPATCPSEAEAIVKAVGGCSAVNKNQYPSVYEKCCAAPVSAPAVTPAPAAPTPAPVLKPTVSPFPVAPTPVSKPAIKTPTPKPLKYSEPFRDFPYVTSATPTPETAPAAKAEIKPLKAVQQKVQQFFGRLFRFLRFR